MASEWESEAGSRSSGAESDGAADIACCSVSARAVGAALGGPDRDIKQDTREGSAPGSGMGACCERNACEAATEAAS